MWTRLALTFDMTVYWETSSVCERESADKKGFQIILEETRYSASSLSEFVI